MARRRCSTSRGRSATPGRRGFWVGELQGGFGTIALNVSPTVTPEDLRVWTWSALARGAKGINYYAWYPMSSGYESGGFGLIHLDGTITSARALAGEIARVVDQHQELLLDARPPRAEVAIVYNPLAHFVGGRQRAAAYGGPQGEVAGIERDSLLGVYRALFPTQRPDRLRAHQPSGRRRLNQYRLVILPYPPMLPQASAAAIREYVQNGGALVAEARLGWNNERGYASDACRASASRTSSAPGSSDRDGPERPHVHCLEQRRSSRCQARETSSPPAGTRRRSSRPSPSARVVGRFANGRRRR